MKKVTLKKLSVENYKKFEAREFDFAGRTEVSGRNRQGKTSLMDAYFDVLTGKLADGTLPNNIRRKVDGEEVDDPVVRELVIDVDGTEYVIQKKTKKGKSSNTVEYYVNGIKRNKTEYMEILKRIADPDTIAMCSNARVFLNEIQKATAKARETLGGIAGFSESRFRAEHPEYEWIKNEGVEGDSIEEILKARRRDLRKAKSDVDDIAKQIRKEQSRQVECDETLPAQRDDLLDLLKESEKQEKALCDASREYDRMQKQGIGLYFYSGTKGSGKTRMVCSLANELIEKHQKQVKFSTSMKILDEIKSTWGKRYSPDKTEEQLIDELARADILIIDDFGTETEKDWVNEKYYEIIDGRYTSRKITIFTSNYCISRLNYDERITNRILERSLEIPFPEESVREHIAETMKQQMIAGIMGGGK